MIFVCLLVARSHIHLYVFFSTFVRSLSVLRALGRSFSFHISQNRGIFLLYIDEIMSVVTVKR